MHCSACACHSLPQLAWHGGGTASQRWEFPPLHRFIPDRLMKVYSIPRTTTVVFLGALSAGAAVLNSFAGIQLLNASSFLAGFAFGGMQACAHDLCCAALRLQISLACVVSSPAACLLKPC